MNRAKPTWCDPILRRMEGDDRWRFAEGAAMMLEHERDRVSDDAKRPRMVAWVLRDTARRFPDRGASREARAVGRLLRAAVRMLGGK